MKDDTILSHAGLHPHDNQGIVNPPVYHASTVLFPTLESYRNASNARVRYGRRGTPTTFALEEAMTALEGGEGTVLAPSGLAAIAVSLTACVESGDHVLVTDSTYSPTRRFCDDVLSRFGVETDYYDPMIGGESTHQAAHDSSLHEVVEQRYGDGPPDCLGVCDGSRTGGGDHRP